ncbi:hypothetical protein Tco_0805369 [Tanacetum coccineum]
MTYIRLSGAPWVVSVTLGDILLLESLLNSDPSPSLNQGNYLLEIKKELKVCKSAESSINENNSIDRSNVQKNLYRALLEAYNFDKDLLSSYGEVVTLKRGRGSSGAQMKRQSLFTTPFALNPPSSAHRNMGAFENIIIVRAASTSVRLRLSTTLTLKLSTSSLLSKELALVNFQGAAVSLIPGIVDAYLANKMHEAIKTAIQLQSDRLIDEAQAENEDLCLCLRCRLVPSCFVIFDLEPLSLSLDFVGGGCSPSFTPFEGSDFLMEEIDEFLEHDDSIPPGVDGIYDSDRDTIYLEELLNIVCADDMPASASGNEGLDLSSEGWLAECLVNDSGMHFSFTNLEDEGTKGNDTTVVFVVVLAILAPINNIQKKRKEYREAKVFLKWICDQNKPWDAKTSQDSAFDTTVAKDTWKTADTVPAVSAIPTTSIPAGSINQAAGGSAVPSTPSSSMVEPVHADDTPLPPGHSLGSSKNSTRFPSPLKNSFTHHYHQ